MENLYFRHFFARRRSRNFNERYASFFGAFVARFSILAIDNDSFRSLLESWSMVSAPRSVQIEEPSCIDTQTMII